MTQSILVSLWNQSDRKTCFFMPLEKNGRKRRRPEPVKLSRFEKIVNRVKELWG